MANIITYEDVQSKIVQIRGQEVILDYEVAALYGVETREINQAVRNNLDKFPQGWVFELDKQESAALRSRISTLKEGTRDSLRSNLLILDDAGRPNIATTKPHKGQYSKHNYKAFTERGLYMLATILKSKQATATRMSHNGSLLTRIHHKLTHKLSIN